MGTKAFDNYADLITFSRASGGTALRPVSYGPELVTNTWVDNSAGSSSISELNGELTLTCVGSDVAWAYEQINLKTGALYVVSYEVKQDVGGNVHVYIGETTAGSQSYSKLASVGFHADSFIASANTSYISLREFTAGTAIVDNISVKEVLFDQPDGTLTLFNHLNNIPRIEYDADGNRLGLLIEEQRTNLLTYSNDFTDASWNSSNITYSQNVTGPNGVANSAWTATISSAGNRLRTTGNTVTAGTSYTFSFYAKKGTATGVNYAVYDVSNTAFIVSNTSYEADINETDWSRIVVTFTAPVGCTSVYVYLASGSASAGTIYFYGAQLEAGAFSTSYIPTSGSTATRAADVASIPVADFGYNQRQGTLFVEYVPKVVTSDIRAAFDLTEEAGSTDNRVYHSASTGTHWLVRSGGSLQAAIDAGTTTANQTNKVAGVYKVNDFAVTIDGGTVATDTNGSVPVSIGRLFIGKLYNGYEINGHIKSIAYYPRRLTDHQLIALTADRDTFIYTEANDYLMTQASEPILY